jgi:hypothetical protein
VSEGWLRSTRCETANCVEVTWMKSAASGPGGCVEVGAGEAGEVLMRDSKDPVGPVLRFTWAEWRAFVDGIGELDDRLTRH